MPPVTHTDALFADQSHSIRDNLMALLGHSRAWNCSAETARAARQSSGELLHSNANRTRLTRSILLYMIQYRRSAHISEWLLRVRIADLHGSRRERPGRTESCRSWTSVSPSLTAAPAGGSSSRLDALRRARHGVCRREPNRLSWRRCGLIAEGINRAAGSRNNQSSA